MRGSPPSVTTHITGIQSANSHPETSAQRPETRNPFSTTIALPDGRVEHFNIAGGFVEVSNDTVSILVS